MKQGVTTKTWGNLLKEIEEREPLLKRNGWNPSPEYLKPFIKAVEYFTDAPAESGKPVYHSLLHLAAKLPGFTGLSNSTPVYTWSEEQRIKKWRWLQARAMSRLNRARSGMTRKEREPVTTKTKTSKKIVPRKTEAVTTKPGYTRFQPNPKKYESNAARQRAYRQRAKGTVTTKTV